VCNEKVTITPFALARSNLFESTRTNQFELRMLGGKRQICSGSDCDFVVACENYRAMCVYAVETTDWVVSIADDVAQTPQFVNATTLNVSEDRVKRLDIAVNIGKHSDSSGIDFQLAHRTILSVGAKRLARTLESTSDRS
jgi:hypothetical protein